MYGCKLPFDVKTVRNVAKHSVISHILTALRVSCLCRFSTQWRRQNVKTTRSFPGQYGRKAGHSRLTFCSK